jgi:hypothetical protein
MEEPDLIFSSMTQDAQTIEAVLNKDFDSFESTVLTDKPESAAPPPEPPAATPAAPPPTPPAAEPAGDPAGEAEEEEEVPAAPPVQDPTPPPAEPAHKPKPGSKKYKEQRDKAIADLARATQEKADLERKLAEVTAGRTAPETAAPAAAPAPAAAAPAEELGPEPQLDDVDKDGNPLYPDYKDFSKALTRWTLKDERIKADKAAESARQAREEEDRKQRRSALETQDNQRWAAAVQSAKDAFPDFDEVMAKPRQRIIPPALITAVRDHADGGKLAYLLETHPEVEARLAKLAELPQNPSDREVRLVFGRLYTELSQVEAEVAGKAPAVQTPPAAAPASREARAAAAAAAPQAAAPAPQPPKKFTPPTPVGSRGTPGYRTLKQMTEKELREMDIDEFRRRRDSGE